MAVPQAGLIMFEVQGPIARSDLPGLSARICSLLSESGPAIALCDVASVDADAVTIDALARLALAARRHRCRIMLIHVSPALHELLEFLGLSDVLPEF